MEKKEQKGSYSKVCLTDARNGKTQKDSKEDEAHSGISDNLDHPSIHHDGLKSVGDNLASRRLNRPNAKIEAEDEREKDGVLGLKM